jgi:TolB-like protein
MSGDPEQEFFSDGITEEITATLAKIPDLKIVARTSAFQFKAQNRDIQSIGRQLHATHLIEGSVRHDGNRVRITAQLIAAETGVKVSSESYDRQISDIFATQEDIARTIVGALMAPLVLAPGERLVSNWGIDAESYQQFLRAKALVRARGQVRPAWELTDAAALLKPIVVRYPKFAPAWAQLALIYERLPAGLPANITIGDRRRAAEQWLGKAEAAAEHAIELDAKLPDGYSALGLVMTMRGRFLRAEELLSKALAVDPFYPEALHTYANLLSAVGRHKEALATREQITSIEPFVQVYQSNLFGLLWINGQTDALSARLKDTRAPNGRSNLAFFARMAAAEGHYSEAADILKSMPRNVYPDGMLDDAIRLLRTAPSAPVSPQTVPRLDASLDFAYLHVSDEPIFQSLEQAVAAGYLPPINMVMIWQPAFATLRRTERFKAFARDYGLVDYWRTKGWPSECRPVGVDDFECH